MILIAALATAPAIASAGAKAPAVIDQWPQWRGPLGTGVAPHGNPPVSWGEGQNVRWKVAIPGRGHSTPIVWGDRVFITTAVPYGEDVPVRTPDAPGAHDNVPSRRPQRFVVLALRRRDGAILWERTVRSERPHEGTHVTGSWASPSAVTDGERLVASFGSRGLYGLDMEGGLRWQADPGDMHTLHGHGEGSSPALHGDTVVVNWDHEGGSFVMALDARTGKERWRAARDEVTSWSTPLIVAHGGRMQAIISATGRVRGYDLATGRVIWECGGLSHNVVASPVAADGHVYVASSYETRAMLAIRLAGAEGDITGTGAVAWSRHRDTPYVPSLLLYGDMLYFLKHNQGVLTVLRAKTGETLFGPGRLDGIYNVFASPVGAADRIYVVSREGTTAVVRRGGAHETLALNRLEDSFSASPAVAGDELYLRGERSLYCIAEDRAG